MGVLCTRYVLGTRKPKGVPVMKMGMSNLLLRVTAELLLQ